MSKTTYEFLFYEYIHNINSPVVSTPSDTEWYRVIPRWRYIYQEYERDGFTQHESMYSRTICHYMSQPYLDWQTYSVLYYSWSLEVCFVYLVYAYTASLIRDLSSLASLEAFSACSMVVYVLIAFPLHLGVEIIYFILRIKLNVCLKTAI